MSRITEQDLVQKVSTLVSQVAGIQLGAKQVAQVQSKLAQRMRKLNITQPDEYAAYLDAHRDQETDALVSLLTTHHTFFFRESYHFDFLAYKALPQVVERVRAKGQKKIRIWSAASSTGQEAYSLSMLLHHHLPLIAPDMTYEILGTDIDPQSVATAKNGVYRWDDLKSVPNLYLGTHWVRGTEEIKDFVKAKPSIKQHCQFQVDNLIDLKLPKTEKFDFIFCRNVFIYFAPEQIRTITQQLIDHLEPHGYLMIGHSESLTNLSLPLTFLGQSVYTRSSNKAPETAPTKSAAPSTKSAKTPTAVIPATPDILRVMCVDDSPTVLTLLKKILNKQYGFEVVATAANGKQAAEVLKQHTVDVMTLDIHMPEQNGLEYLRTRHSSQHPPVVMVSSVSRDDADLAYQCLQAGAAEYIEKPSLNDMEKVGQQLRTKLRSAFEAKRLGQVVSLELDKEFKKSATILQPETKLRVIVAPYGSLKKAVKVLKEMRAPQPPTLLLVDHPGNLFDKLATQIKRDLMGASDMPATPKDMVNNKIYFGDLDQVGANLKAYGENRMTVVGILGAISDAGQQSVLSLPKASYILEDNVAHPAKLKDKAREIVPATSLMYETDKILSEGTKAHEQPKTRVS